MAKKKTTKKSESKDAPLDDDLKGLEQLKSAYDNIREQMARTIVGQSDVIEQLLVCVFARGHCMLEGVPGLAKTLMVKTLAQCLSMDFNRIQFTPDLMPSDITGTDVMHEDRATGHREFQFIKGPLFTNVLLADEINRTPPKTQAALLEAMQEHQVTVGGQRYPLPEPFFVLATQNPIEQEGTYPLPEAQLDRFFIKVFVGYPDSAEEKQIYRLMTGDDIPEPEPVLDAEQIMELQHVVRRVPISEFSLDYVMRLVRATRPDDDSSPQFIRDWLLWGAGPRAGQSLILAAKARAALYGRPEVEVPDIQHVATAVMRHRLVLNYNAEAAGQTVDSVIAKLVETVPTHESEKGVDERVQRVLKT